MDRGDSVSFCSKVQTNSEKILIAMSGGVDSSVSALLLKQQGYEIIGVTLNFGNFCCNKNLISDAKKVAKKLEIKHFVIDCELDFKTNVVDYFVDSYLKGETPNPCVKCNREIKFVKLLEFADKIGATKLATGHYARIVKNDYGVFELRKSFNEQKDQSYFLSMLPVEFLGRVLFPLGEFNSKEDVRKIAKKNNLFVAEKKDSQDICFISDNNNYKKLIEKYSTTVSKKGNIILQSTGEKIGEHNGIIDYTIGQRRGLGLAYSEPLYVINIDKDNNTVFVGTEQYLYSSEVYLKNINLLDNSIKLNESVEVLVKLRSTHKGGYGEFILSENNEAIVKLKNPVKSITNGQVCTGYVGDKVVFGGWIS